MMLNFQGVFRYCFIRWFNTEVTITIDKVFPKCLPLYYILLYYMILRVFIRNFVYMHLPVKLFCPLICHITQSDSWTQDLCLLKAPLHYVSIASPCTLLRQSEPKLKRVSIFQVFNSMNPQHTISLTFHSPWLGNLTNEHWYTPVRHYCSKWGVGSEPTKVETGNTKTKPLLQVAEGNKYLSACIVWRACWRKKYREDVIFIFVYTLQKHQGILNKIW